MRPQRSILIAVPTALIALTLLSGCVDEAAPEPDPAASTTAPTTPPTPTPPATTPAHAPDGVPVTTTCDQLVSAQAMLDYNANFTLLDSYSPAAGSLAAEIVRQNGLACAWVNGSNGSLIEVAVANLPEPHLTTVANELVTTSNSVPTYGVEGYFTAAGGVGTAQAISSPYWLVAVSPTFFEPGDAQPIVAAALAGLG